MKKLYIALLLFSYMNLINCGKEENKKITRPDEVTQTSPLEAQPIVYGQPIDQSVNENDIPVAEVAEDAHQDESPVSVPTTLLIHMLEHTDVCALLDSELEQNGLNSLLEQSRDKRLLHEGLRLFVAIRKQMSQM